MVMIEIELSKPVEAHGEQISKLTLRDPVAGDVMECGYPVKSDGKGGGGMDAEVIGKLVVKLANVPPSTVKSLSISDFNKCIEVVMGFFG